MLIRALKKTDLFKKSFVLICLLFNAGCFYENTGEMIYIISKAANSNGKIEVPSEKFQAVLAHTVFRSNRSALDVLNQQTQDSEFKLTRMSLGLELEAKIGIQNVAEISKECAFEMRFERLPPPK